MTRFVVDATTLLHVLDDGRAISASHQLVAPAAIRSQVMDLLLQRVDRGDLSEPQALALHEKLTQMRMRLLNDRVSRRVAWDIARTSGWTTMARAEYIALVKLQADALVTVDPDLAAAAAGIVPVVEPERLFSPDPASNECEP
ncbi:type II toxin-antitoxin system VapC family toxin [Tessaracoccus sp. G1721]